MLFRSLFAAFSMYSRIPVPKFQWERDCMKYVLCFFPFVGVVLGIVVWIFGMVLIESDCSSLLFGCVMTVVPLFITGGIHFDGFLDTMDGYCSFADKKKRLEILKDSNSGAFAIMGGLVYFTLSVGFWSEIDSTSLQVISFGYVISRAFSALGVVLFPKAKENGLAADFAGKSDNFMVIASMTAFIIFDIIILSFINFFGAVLTLFLAGICFLFHYRNCIKNFGGITGDLAGFFLQVTELVFIIVSAVVL